MSLRGWPIFHSRYVPVSGGLAYLSYHRKLWHAPLGEEPFVTYERLTARVPARRFCVATTGVQRDSGSVHALPSLGDAPAYVACACNSLYRPDDVTAFVRRAQRIGDAALSSA
jgi:hypothetical protein